MLFDARHFKFWSGHHVNILSGGTTVGLVRDGCGGGSGAMLRHSSETTRHTARLSNGIGSTAMLLHRLQQAASTAAAAESHRDKNNNTLVMLMMRRR